MKKLTWLLLTSFMVVTLLLPSCKQETGETDVPDKPVETPSTDTPTTPTTPEVVVTSEPRYGGTLNLMETTDFQGFDHGMYPAGFLNHVYLVNDTLLSGDWSRGAAGTGEIDWALSSQKRIEYTVGELAESFEIREPGTIAFTIREGVHYGLNPDSEASLMVNGREMTVDDVLFSLDRHINSPMSYMRITRPTLPDTTTVTLEGDRTIVVTTSIDNFDALWLLIGEREIWPRELIETYGGVTEWQNMVGTGPYMMTEYIQGSSATFTKNPNYYQTDPVGEGKGNQLPYLDGIRMLIVTDVSTQLAAMRSGEVDRLMQLNYDNYVDLTNTAPHLKYHKYMSTPMAISMRQDKADLPFSDIRVRQALMMAIDYDTIIDAYYNGDAVKLAWPLADIKGYDNAYMPLEEMPESVQELFSYNPEQAKQLLTEAGYPDGFKTKIVTASAYSAWVEYLSIIKDMWAKIDVDLTLELHEVGTYFNLTMSRQYDEMLYGFFVQPGPYAQLTPFAEQSTFNRSWVQDTRVLETYQEILQYNLIDQAKVDELHREIMPYVMEKAWYIPDPGAYAYNFWQPWVKNYYGEGLIGYKPSWVRYTWIDQDMKQDMLKK